MPYHLVPAPISVTSARSGFAADMGVSVNVEAEAATAAEFLADAVRERTGFALGRAHRRSKSRALWMGREKPAKLLEKAARAFAKVAAKRESYALVINSTGLAAVAGNEAGLFYAAATAAQLLTTKSGRPFWPSCAIVDAPELSLRALHLDLKHHMERFEYLWSLVPRLASFKINALVLELEDKFLYERRPEIAAPVGFCAARLQEFVDLCRAYHVEFVPLVQGLGHASYILKHPEYAALREKKGNFAEFCPQAEGTYEVLFDLYEEVAAATQGTKYFHIGGDEAWLVGSCPKCRKALKERGKFSLFKQWLDRSADKVASLGRTPMVWDDMLVKHAGDDYSGLSKDLFYVRWNYRANAAETCAPQIERYGQSGLNVILAASADSGYPYLPNHMEHFVNIDGFGKAAASADLAGILATTWEDTGNHTESFWPGLAATAQAGWNPSVDLDGEFMLEFARVFHGGRSGRLAAVYADLGELAPRCFSLLSPKSPYDCEGTYGVPSLEPSPEGESWRDFHAGRIAEAHEIASKLREAREVLSREILDGRRTNVYALEVLLAAVRIMAARVKLFFALADSETAVEDARGAAASGDGGAASRLLESAAVAVERALGEGEESLERLKAVWERTRMPQDMSLVAPPGKKYIHDYRNYRHLAGKTMDMGYLLFVERRMGAVEFARDLRDAAGRVRESGDF